MLLMLIRKAKLVQLQYPMHHHPQSDSAYNQSTAIKLLDSYHHRCTLLSSLHYYRSFTISLIQSALHLFFNQSTKRARWVKRDIAGPESIADHMYRMGLMALIASDTPRINRGKCIKMGIVHDIAEVIVGDITPSDGIPKLEKSRMEKEALDHMCKLLGGGSRGKECKVET
ncbi:hypothetical protein L1887_22778 [Cichorium endivia]|nr:hypothetical protein L1887_22778 [Cichorium endivia]